MADDTQPYGGHAAGELDPSLKQFVGLFPPGTDGREWADTATARLQQHLTLRAVAKQNEAAGQAFVNNLHEFKSNLVDMVKGDPTTSGLALDMIPHTINAMAAQHQNLDPTLRDAAAKDLTDHMSSEVAHATVQSLAENDANAASQALQSPRLSGLLSDEDRASLGNYIGSQAALRNQDNQAAQQQSQHDAALQGYDRGTAYFHSFMDPSTGQLQLPQTFGQRVMQDTQIPNETSAALHMAYTQLQTSGDPQKSNPSMVADFFNRAANGTMPSQPELLSHVGSNLTLADAAMLNHFMGPQTPGGQQDVKAINDTIQGQRDNLLTPDNGPAGQGAFNRFMDWLPSTLRSGVGTGIPVRAMLDPEHKDTVLNQLPRFQPTAQDGMPTPPSARPPLSDIFQTAFVDEDNNHTSTRDFGVKLPMNRPLPDRPQPGQPNPNIPDEPPEQKVSDNSGGTVAPLPLHEMTPRQLIERARVNEDTNILGDRKMQPGATDAEFTETPGGQG